MKIGFIGLGIMGKPMALNLVKAGYSLVVFNRSREAVDELLAAGAASAVSPAAVGKESGVILTMLPDSPQVQEVLLGPDGVIHGVRAGQIVVDLSSIDPTSTRQFGNEFKARGVEMLDSPVSGGQERARSGQLAFMVGGDENALSACRPILAAMGTSVTHVGPLGAGNIVKLVNQAIVGVNIAIIAETLCFARRAGVDPERVVAAIKGGLAGSNCLNDKAPRMLRRDYAPGFRLALHAKDLRNALKAARDLGLPLPLTAKVAEMVEGLASGEAGSKDHAALAIHYEQAGGVSISHARSPA